MFSGQYFAVWSWALTANVCLKSYVAMQNSRKHWSNVRTFLPFPLAPEALLIFEPPLLFPPAAPPISWKITKLIEMNFLKFSKNQDHLQYFDVSGVYKIPNKIQNPVKVQMISCFWMKRLKLSDPFKILSLEKIINKNYTGKKESLQREKVH